MIHKILLINILIGSLLDFLHNIGYKTVFMNIIKTTYFIFVLKKKCCFTLFFIQNEYLCHR